MKLGIVLNDIYNETLPSTSINIVIKALQMGHELFITDVGGLAYDPNDTIHANVIALHKQSFKDAKSCLDYITSAKVHKDRITVEELDILLLRNDPAADFDKPWAQHAGLMFGQLAVKHDVIVLNDPTGLAKSLNKLYFQQFPKIIRLDTLISKTFKDIQDFYYKNNKKIIIKPLQGSGGRNVFLVQPEDEPNIKQMCEAVMRDGYVIAQEFFPPAAQGDIRLFMLNGRPLQVDGKYAALKRVSGGHDIRNNIHAGGHAEGVEISDKILELTEIVRPKLIQDGIFFAGLDIVEDKLLEVNIFSPGGLNIASKFAKVDFVTAFVEALEKKVNYKRYYKHNFDNIEMNTL
jgi:glutathione synthase